MSQKYLLSVAVVAVIAFAVPQIRGLSLSLFRKLRSLAQSSFSPLPDNSQAVLGAPDPPSEETGDTTSGPSDVHGQDGEEGCDSLVSDASSIEGVEVSASCARGQFTPSGREVNRRRNISSGVAPPSGAAGSASSAPSHEMADVHPNSTLHHVAHAERSSIGGRSDVGTDMRPEHGCVGRPQSSHARSAPMESRRNSTIPLTCARCGLVGHRAMHCNRPFVPIPRHWSYPMRGLAQLLRERAGVPVEWE